MCAAGNNFTSTPRLHSNVPSDGRRTATFHDHQIDLTIRKPAFELRASEVILLGDFPVAMGTTASWKTVLATSILRFPL